MSNASDPDQQLRDLIETVQYGEADEGVAKLKQVMSQQIAQGIEDRRLALYKEAEVKRSREASEAFRRKNSSFVDNGMQEAALRHAMVAEQYKDLSALLAQGKWPGYTPDYLSQLTPQQVVNWHLDLRSNPTLATSVRSAAEMMDAAAEAFESQFGVKLHRTGSTEELAHRHVNEMKKVAKQQRGHKPEEWEAVLDDEDISSNVMWGGEHGTTTPRDETLRWMGDGQSGSNATDERYSRGFEAIARNRFAANEPRDGTAKKRDA
jgi:hypothetical protein